MVPASPLLPPLKLVTFPLVQTTPLCPQRLALVFQPRDPLFVKPFQKAIRAAWSIELVWASRGEAKKTKKREREKEREKGMAGERRGKKRKRKEKKKEKKRRKEKKRKRKEKKRSKEKK